MQQFDVNGDGKFDNQDAEFVARAIFDPNGSITQGNLAADVNSDGQVNHDDLQQVIDALVQANGLDSIKPLTPDYLRQPVDLIAGRDESPNSATRMLGSSVATPSSYSLLEWSAKQGEEKCGMDVITVS